MLKSCRKKTERVRATFMPALFTAIVVVLETTGCVPHVSHGPRIESGTRWFATAAVVHADGVQSTNSALLPSMYAGVARGWIREGDGPAVSLGVQVPVFLMPAVVESASGRWFLATSYADIYLQPRRSSGGGLDFGVGALVSSGAAMPYVQLGRSGDGGFYTTNGLAFTYGPFTEARYWISEIAFRAERPDGSRGVDVYVSGAIGQEVSGDEQWYLSGGVVVDFPARR